MIYLFEIILLLYTSSRYDSKKIAFGVHNKAGLWYLSFFLFFFLIAGLRYNIGGDTVGYAYNFSHYSKLYNLTTLEYKYWDYQPGWVFLMSFFRTITRSFILFQLCHALFINIVIFNFIKRNSTNVFLALIIYFVINYFEFNTEILRESIAVAFGLLSYKSFCNKKYILGFGFIILAFLFHVSALILVLYPLLMLVKYSKKLNIVAIVATLLIPFLYLALPNLFEIATTLFRLNDAKMNQYVIQDVNFSLNIFYYIRLSVSAFIIPYFSLYIVGKHKPIAYAGFIYVYVILQVLSMFSYGFYRFANYFTPFYWLLLADALWYIFSSIKIGKTALNKIFFLTVVSFLLLYVYQSTQLNYNIAGNDYYYERYIPYKSVLFSDKPY